MPRAGVPGSTTKRMGLSSTLMALSTWSMFEFK